MAVPPVLAIGLQVAGTLFQGFSAMQAANYQSAVARNNAIIAQQQADLARTQGLVEAQTQGIKTAGAEGAIEAQQGSSGIDISGRSSEDVRASTAALGRLDALTAYNNAEQRAYGFEVKKTEYLAEAQAKKAAATSGMLGTLIGAVGGVSERWQKLQSQGIKLI